MLHRTESDKRGCTYLAAIGASSDPSKFCSQTRISWKAELCSAARTIAAQDTVDSRTIFLPGPSDCMLKKTAGGKA
eukprot:5380392-Pyramimonas_sp.AAC.1